MPLSMASALHRGEIHRAVARRVSNAITSRAVSEMAITDVTGSVQLLGAMCPDRAANV
ncbi:MULTISPECIES: hypothetical protein [Xanthomonas]|uniref:hypothetical protein n=1 Tax=Xanthomonas TaxID=338 RepID=UPI00186B1129|nr:MULTISPECIES: hypothetical protein [Xanthomonas]MDY4297118.1 hypothetical protein [Xanthomonas sp. LF02-5]MDY4340753.1 hypothetical protein [Xanthomonas sp. LF07-6]MDY4358921.1 hypothetical protein [Xanthomonas sp. LF04-12]UYK81848.1 hypothetical protein NG829_05915 [Xanthomonas sacchari]